MFWIPLIPPPASWTQAEYLAQEAFNEQMECYEGISKPRFRPRVRVKMGRREV